MMNAGTEENAVCQKAQNLYPMQRLGILPPRCLLIAILLMAALGYFLPGPAFLDWPLNLAGLLPLAFGFWLACAGSNLFAKVETEIQPFKNSSILVTEGPYRWSRHPMYLGMALVLVGIGILMGAFVPLAVVVGFTLLMHYGYILPEEKMMEARFGQQYREYSRKVRRWV